MTVQTKTAMAPVIMTKTVMGLRLINMVARTVMIPMHPLATNASDNTADNIDNNCNGQVDEGVGGIDNDGDGFTTLTAIVMILMQHQSRCNRDWYDGIDQDCDGADDYDQDGDGETAGGYGGTDCDDTNAVLNSQTTWFADLDGDGYGDTNDVQTICAQPTGYILDDGDCDDTNENSNPAAESCDGMDNDCDGSIPLNESD